MSHFGTVLYQFPYPGYIVRDDRHAVFKRIVDGHKRNIALCKLDDLGIVEIHTRDQDSVKSTVSCMCKIIHIAHASGRKTPVYECDIVAFCIGHGFETVQKKGKEFIGKSVARFIKEQNSDIIGSVSAQDFCSGIGLISHAFGSLTDLLPRCLTDIRLPAQSLAHGSYRYPAFSCYILHGNHFLSPRNPCPRNYLMD